MRVLEVFDNNSKQVLPGSSVQGDWPRLASTSGTRNHTGLMRRCRQLDQHRRKTIRNIGLARPGQDCGAGDYG